MKYSLHFSFCRKLTYRLLCSLLIFIYIHPASAQVWSYDFGTSTGRFELSGSSTNFLPQPLYGNSRVNIGDGGGAFALVNAGTDLGSHTELTATASSNTNVNKISLFDCSPGPAAYMKYGLRFTNGTSGNWYLYIGNGSSFSNDAAIEPSQAFAGIKWSFNTDGSVDAYLHANGGLTPFSAATFQQDVNYVIEIFANNGSDILYYDHSVPQQVESKKMDIWVDGELLFDDILKFDLPNNAPLSSWMFYGENSASNSATLILDDILFAREFEVPLILPTRFYNFYAASAGQHINLFWENLTESNIQKYLIERSVNGVNFSPAGEKTAYLNNGTKATYQFADAFPNSGNNYYRIKALDLSGKTIYSSIVKLSTGKTKDISVYPNPVFDNRLNIQLQDLPKDQYKIYLVNAVAQEHLMTVIDHKGGSLTKSVELPDVSKSGLYQLKIKSAKEVFIHRIMLY